MKSDSSIYCCFIGHRKIENSATLIKTITDTIENLILSENVTCFLFGSRSEFDDICYNIVTNLKIKYPYILRIACPCKHEGVNFENEKSKMENLYHKITNKQIKFSTFDDALYFAKYKNAGRASYIERNIEMINNSYYCLFYYNKKCSLKNSGTAIAYKHAEKNKKVIINFVK